MTLTTVLPVDQILLPLTAADRLGAIDELLASLSLDTAALDRVRAAVIAREHELTTGIGGGVAIPHARVEGIDSPLLALGIAPDGLDFGAIDGAPVQLVFLLISGAEQTDAHLAVLSELCTLLNDPDWRGRLAACATAEEAASLLA
jgi:mannitol/fructose-specific phosphotransferase system IIA component (Ntr-type)